MYFQLVLWYNSKKKKEKLFCFQKKVKRKEKFRTTTQLPQKEFFFAIVTVFSISNRVYILGNHYQMYLNFQIMTVKYIVALQCLKHQNSKAAP